MNTQTELTILMPCLNEQDTIKICIQKAKKFIEENNIDAEILIANNGSTDNSKEIALKEQARVIDVEERGYGSALRGGIEQANGKYIIMGDCDDSYDFEHLTLFLEKLRNGQDLVMGNRFKGGIASDAMSFSHRLGVPVLSWMGRVLFKTKVGDFHCGLRGFNKESIQKLNLNTIGMEFATEMIAKAARNNLKIVEVPTTLKKDGRNRPPHLRTVRDGFRHVFFMIKYAFGSE